MQIQELIKKIIYVSYLNKEGHIPSSLSILTFLDYLYSEVLTSQDIFILSKGHGCLGLYAILLKNKIITEQDFFSFCKKNSILGGHPSSKKIPSVLLSTGSLGHGLPFCVGLALAKKIKNEPGNIYCLIGDGEANEGTTWESALIASTYGLGKLYCIMDFNKSGERAIRLRSCIDKFNSFNWMTFYCSNGNNSNDIKSTFTHMNYICSMSPTTIPKFIQLDTIKGHGCKLIEDNPEWHHKYPKNEEELEKLLNSIYYV